jgi:hypothetical protein
MGALFRKLAADGLIIEEMDADLVVIPVGKRTDR